ncbi:MAG: hypothetical protein A2Y95_11485 [Deltaproteobacteria bacterium RBG_13_65_10]|nr:MAG: hypothetical protein A2Y95_11485 [Deltaproteobacteria bacterium RBG_13_65_10]
MAKKKKKREPGAKPFPLLRFDRLKTYPLARGKRKVSASAFAGLHVPGDSFKAFLDRLPPILAASDLRAVIERVATAARAGRTVIVGLGAHVIKVGLSPIVIDLMARRVISCVAMNGAGVVHDLEIALAGRTSEEVLEELETGRFGMARDTAEHIHAAVARCAREGLGYGRAVGGYILRERFPHRDLSILAQAERLGIPVTVHVAIGTDIHHMHASADGAALGAASLADFRTFCEAVATIEHGAYLNVGSAVILPEVFLKAVSVARNLGHPLRRFTTVNLDFLRHYRTTMNVVTRPVARGGKGFHLTGPHEILLPLIAAGVIERLGQRMPHGRSRARRG